MTTFRQTQANISSLWSFMFKNLIKVCIQVVFYPLEPATAKTSTKNYLSELERHRLILIHKHEIPGVTKRLANL